MKFVAIDFETAAYEPDSACAVALVAVEDGAIIRKEYRLICPPRDEFVFTYIHGITYEHVAREPTFNHVWPVLEPLLDGAHFLVAHNAPFDEKVLRAACATYGLIPPATPFLCTVRLARKHLGIYPTNLPAVCQRLGIDLNHHNALSDAEACARIMMQIDAGHQVLQKHHDRRRTAATPGPGA